MDVENIFVSTFIIFFFFLFCLSKFICRNFFSSFFPRHEAASFLRSIPLRREETERWKGFGAASCGSLFSETGDAFISGGVPERNRGDAKTTAADVNSWHAPFCSASGAHRNFFFAFQGRKFLYRLRGNNLEHFPISTLGSKRFEYFIYIYIF